MTREAEAEARRAAVRAYLDADLRCRCWHAPPGAFGRVVGWLVGGMLRRDRRRALVVMVAEVRRTITRR